MVDELRVLGWTIEVRELIGNYPSPSQDEIEQAANVFRSLPHGAVVVVDGLAFGAIPDVVRLHGQQLLLVALVHMPLAEEWGLDVETVRIREEQERRALAAASAVIATGRGTAVKIAQYGVPANRISVVEPGIDTATIAEGCGDGIVELLCVAAVTPGKGHDVLVRALTKIRDLRWHLTCAGSLTRNTETVRLVRAAVADAGVGDRVSFTGELSECELNERYARTDVFVLATRRETFGMAVAEALARGIPVVATDAGEIRSLVGDAGIVMPPDDDVAFASALEKVVRDSAYRRSLRQSAIEGRQRLRTWNQAARSMAHVLEQLPQ